jgi:O-antigen/teichoic acid export membrane protein
MTSKHIIAKNSIYNLIGQAVQVGTAIIIIPFIIARLGVKLYGLWAILSALSNYQGLLDLGSTCVKYIAEYKAKKDWAGLRDIIATGFYTSLLVCWDIYSGMPYSLFL